MDITTANQTWTPICAIADIPRLGSRVVQRTDAENIAVFRSSDDHIFALIDRCPHQGGPLSAGLVHGHAVTCPLHGWTLGLESGQAQAPDQGCAHTVAVRIQSGQVYLDLAAKASP